MTPSLLLRPVLACAAAASLSACGMIDSDPHRFEAMAESVAAIPLDGEAGAATARTQAETGLRPALRVQVMDPHALWDARDGGLGRMAGDPAPRLAAMAPSTAEAVVQTVSARLDSAAAKAGLRPAQPQRPKAPSGANAALVQIGAYSSEAAARAAWARLDRSRRGRWPTPDPPQGACPCLRSRRRLRRGRDRRSVVPPHRLRRRRLTSTVTDRRSVDGAPRPGDSAVSRPRFESAAVRGIESHG